MGSTGPEIKRLADDSIRRIVAEQAITDLPSIVKELVDNALDAESTTIKIRLFGQGLDIIEVSDDGCGVPDESRPFLAQRYATSKISTFEDIYSGTGLTMGFRGEALFSMACLSQKLVVATRTEDDELAQKLEFGRDGSLDTQSVQSIHRKIGTTVAVIQPFAALPARRADMKRRIKLERSKLFRLMESYAIFNVGVQLNLIDIVGSGREDVALATSSSSSTLDETISSVLGHKFLGTLAQLDVHLGGVIERDDELHDWGISGLISKNPKADLSSRTVNYYCINGRVVELPRMTSLLRKVWTGFGGRKRPSCILNLTLPNDVFDINLSPDKQQVLLSHEQEICQVVEEKVVQLWTSQTQGVFDVQALPLRLQDGEADKDDGIRQRHKRRNAFIHDPSKAKLQHHMEDRKPTTESAEKPYAGVDAQDPNRNIEASHEPTTKKTKVSPIASSPQGPSPTEAPIPSSQGGVRSDKSLDRNLSDMERRQWIEIQSKFNTTEGPLSRRDPSAPVTPDDPSQLKELPERQTRKANERMSDTNAPVSIEGGGMSTSRKQLSLQQFAFQPISNSRSTRQSRRENREKQEEGASNKGQSPTSTSSRHNLDEDQESASSASTCPGSAKDGVELAVTEAKSMSKLAVASRPFSGTTIWETFKGTEEMCQKSRLQRVLMTKRKLDLKTLQVLPGDLSGIPNDVSQSVGIAQAGKATRISISKEQFRSEMQIVGQFNLGFILVRCKKNHLWILDQHACDEKFNFEQLCQNTVLHEQRLLKPMTLDLSPAEEACILDHKHIFEANGFRFSFEPEAPVRKRLALTALPHSGAQDGRKAVQFGKDDVRTLCSILMDGSSYDAGDGGTGTDGNGLHGNNAVRRYASTASTQVDAADRMIARLPKAIAMFASRACRTSIMIGTALSQKEMEKIVRRLADVEHPWNCPHGRPTMRHVGEVLPILLQDERRAAEYITSPTVTVTPITQEPEADRG